MLTARRRRDRRRRRAGGRRRRLPDQALPLRRAAGPHPRPPAAQRRPAAGQARCSPSASCVVDVGARRVTVAGAEVPLRTKEFDLLARLAADAGHRGQPRDAHGRRLGRPLVRLDQDARRPRGRAAPQARRGRRPPDAAPAITTLRGHGYRWSRPSSRLSARGSAHCRCADASWCSRVLAAVLAITPVRRAAGDTRVAQFVPRRRARPSRSARRRAPRSPWPADLAAATPPSDLPATPAVTSQLGVYGTGRRRARDRPGPARDAAVDAAPGAAASPATTTSTASWSWRCR